MKEKNGPTHDGKERTQNSKDFVWVAAEKEGNAEVELHCLRVALCKANLKYGVCREFHLWTKHLHPFH